MTDGNDEHDEERGMPDEEKEHQNQYGGSEGDTADAVEQTKAREDDPQSAADESDTEEADEGDDDPTTPHEQDERDGTRDAGAN